MYVSIRIIIYVTESETHYCTRRKKTPTKTSITMLRNIYVIYKNMPAYRLTYPYTLVPSYPRTLISLYPRTLIPSYSYTLVPSYSHTLVPLYPRTLIPSYPYNLIPSYPRTLIPSYSHTIPTMTSLTPLL